MSHNLFLTKIYKEQYYLQNKLFLGHWSIEDIINTVELGDHKVLAYHWDNSDKLDKDYKYLYELYYRLLKSLCTKLNSIHSLQKSERYWQIIIGPWLEMFLVCVFDRWESLKNALNNYEITNTYSFKNSYYDLIASDLSEFQRLIQSERWNNYLLTEIIKFKKISKINFKVNKVEKNKKDTRIYQTNKFFKNKNSLLGFCDKILGIIQKKPEVVLYQTYFKRKNNLLLFIKNKTLPRLYFEFEKKIELDSPKKNRETLNIDFETKNDFEKFIKNNIFKFMPLSNLESFGKIKEYCKTIPIKTKLIISATGHHNDIFSIWVAQKIDEKSNYFISEHGGCIEDTPKFDAYIKKSDCFLSWNHSDKEKVFQMAPSFYTKKINKSNLIKGDKIYIILAGTHLYNFIAQYALKGSQIINTYNSLKQLNTLPQKIKNKIRFRLHPTSKRWAMEKRVKFDFGDSALCKYKKIDDSFLNASILINIDFQTAFYESMYSQKPVIVFADRKLTNNINPKIKKLFEKFIEQKIIIDNINDLLSHINNISENPLKWWNSEPIKTLRDEFSYLCSRKDDENFIKEITALKKKYEKK